MNCRYFRNAAVKVVQRLPLLPELIAYICAMLDPIEWGPHLTIECPEGVGVGQLTIERGWTYFGGMTVSVGWLDRNVINQIRRTAIKS